ncbi:MAG: hypothetical protein GYB66_06045 [Chloroflexi bacterium]|nr:hypothetical protein [Chloroflexota bacterium]
MTDEQHPNHEKPESNAPSDDATRANEAPPIHPKPRELPRRGYEGQPRPMNPPPPPPLSASGQAEGPERGWTSRRAEPPPVQPSVPKPTPAEPPPPREFQRPSARVIDDRPREPAYRPRRQAKSDSGLYLPWWSLVILIVVAGGTAIALLMAVLNLGGGLIPGDQTPQVIVVTSALQGNTGGNTNPNNAAPGSAQFTPGGIPATQPVIQTAVPVAEPTETALPGVTTGCPLNTIVEVVGTGGVPLMIREEPRQADNQQSLAAEGEQLRIIGGPETSTAVDGSVLEWCQVEGVTVPSRNGWAARQFLAEAPQE